MISRLFPTVLALSAASWGALQTTATPGQTQAMPTATCRASRHAERCAPKLPFDQSLYLFVSLSKHISTGAKRHRRGFTAFLNVRHWRANCAIWLGPFIRALREFGPQLPHRWPVVRPSMDRPLPKMGPGRGKCCPRACCTGRSGSRVSARYGLYNRPVGSICHVQGPSLATVGPSKAVRPASGEAVVAPKFP